jgi:hypothetical protein
MMCRLEGPPPTRTERCRSSCLRTQVVAIEGGKVRHRHTNKEAPLAFAYKPMLLSTLPNARTSTTTEIVSGHRARRFGGRGGAVIGAEPLQFVDGRATFEVVIIKYAGGGNEGVEIGVTCTPPERINLAHDYAAAVRPSWMSSDSGSLWVHGRALYDQGQWKHTRPVNLKAGDVVAMTVTSTGALEVHCNGEWQARWDAAQVDVSKPLYALVGMRAPACGVALRTKEVDVSKVALPDVRAIRLKGLTGRSGEIIDLSKHGRPKYPAAFANVRAISDIRSLYPLILQPWAGRAHGRKGAQPILIRAGPGTGKTWCVMQLLYFLAKGSDAIGAARRAMLREGLGMRCRYLSSGCAEHATRLELTPYVVYVQKLARLLKSAAHAELPSSDANLVKLYMRHEYEGRDRETLDMLEQLFGASRVCAACVRACVPSSRAGLQGRTRVLVSQARDARGGTDAPPVMRCTTHSSLSLCFSFAERGRDACADHLDRRRRRGGLPQGAHRGPRHARARARWPHGRRHVAARGRAPAALQALRHHESHAAQRRAAEQRHSDAARGLGVLRYRAPCPSRAPNSVR